MNKKIFAFMFMFIFALTLVSASVDSLGTFKQGENIRLKQVCSNATYINISSITYPNSSVIVDNIEMTSSGSGEFYYVLTDTNTLGTYTFSGVSDGCNNNFNNNFDITPFGEAPATGNFLVVLILLFFVVSGIAIYSFMWVLNRFVKLDVTLNQVVLSYCSFGIYLMYYYFANYYWGNVFVMDLLESFLWVCGFMNLFIVMVLFVLSLVKNFGEQA